MTILRTDKIAGLESVNAITGSVEFKSHPTGNGTYLSYADSDRIFNFDDGSFTIEFWMKPNVVDTSVLSQDGDHATIIDYGYGNTSNSTNAWWAVHHNDQKIIFAFQNSDQLTSSNFLTANTWHHVSVNHVRTGSSGKTTIYGDGTAVGSMSSTQTFTDALIRELTVGNQNNVNRAFDGKLSNVRVCKGKALYTAAYTPPTRQLEVTPETILLCCQSSQDAGMDATGKNLVPHPNDSASAPPKPSTDVPDVGNDHTHGTVLEGNVEFPSLNYMTLPRGTTTQSNRGRAVMSGFYEGPSTYYTNIEYLNIQSQGNTIKFGDLTLGSNLTEIASCSSSTRALFAGGTVPAPTTGGTKQNIIHYVTIATTGNSVDFGDLTAERRTLGGCSNETRGIFGGGIDDPARLNTIDYVTIATTGDATNFGDLTEQRRNVSAHSSTTRGIFAGGLNPGPAYVNTIDYITIASTGDATNFGDLTALVYATTSCSNSTRGVIMGGTNPSGATNVIDYVTIATTGDAVDFGDLTVARSDGAGVASPTRGLMIGGETPSNDYNTIDYVTIATTGNASDFGDVSVGIGRGQAGSSDCHGGLS